MNRCKESLDLQLYLDGELAESERYRLERHTDQCASCAVELALLRRVFASLDAMPLLDPGPQFTERVLEKVVPSQVRRRWVKVIGWSYAAAFAALVAGVTLWVAQPGTQEMLGSASGVASMRLTGLLVFVLEALAFAARMVAGSWGFAASVFEWFAPLGRAFAPWVAHPSVRVALPAAALACGGLLWWMRAREARESQSSNHVAILGA